MKFGDKVQLKKEYRHYNGEQITNEDGGDFNTELSSMLRDRNMTIAGIFNKTINVTVMTGNELYPMGYTVPAEIFEVVEDENKYSELELQAHKNDSFEKGVQKGIDEEQKYRKECIENAKTGSYKQGYNKGKLEVAVEASKEYLAEKDIDPSILSEVWENGYNAKSGYDEGYKAGYKEGSEKVQSDEFEELLEYENPTYEHHPHYLIASLMNVVEENGFKLIGYDDDSHGNIDINIKLNK